MAGVKFVKSFGLLLTTSLSVAPVANAILLMVNKFVVSPACTVKVADAEFEFVKAAILSV